MMKFKLSILSVIIVVLFINCTSKTELTAIPHVDNPVTLEITKDKLKHWHYKDYGEDSLPGISLDRAYKELIKNKTGKPVIVAIIDTEIDIHHEDLKDNIWTNLKEIPGNGKDDDGNGYTDDIHGWNFIGNAQGDNIIYTNYEYVRVVKKYDAMYGAKTIEDVPEDEKDNFRMFERAKQKYQAELKQTIEYDSIYNVYYSAKDSLRYYFKDDAYTVEMLDSLQNEIPGLKDYIEPVYTAVKYEIPEQEMQQHVRFLKNNLEKYLNVDLNDRNIVGDDPYDLNDMGYGNADVSGNIDELYHGTTVAGPIAAIRNNDIGADGIANNVKIMPLCISTNGDEYDKDIALAIRYAVDNGASIINMSSSKNFAIHPEWVYKALEYAAQNDVLFITSAGNESSNLDEIPYYPNDHFSSEGEVIDNFIVVGSIAPVISNNWKTTSNYGKNNVDIFAPGEDIYTTYPNNSYKLESGTSYATPIVSGVAALLRSRYPKLSAAQVKDIIMKSGVSYTVMVNVPGTGGEEQKPFGELSRSGKVVNAYNAVLMAKQVVKKN